MEAIVEAVNIHNLQLARENVGLTTHYASGRVSATGRDVVTEWEQGRSLPTWSQLSRLAKVYDVPEFAFLSDELLPKNKAIPDFRTIHPKSDRSEIGISKLINLVLTRQRWLETVLRPAGADRNRIQGSGLSLRTPAELAGFIKTTLDIDLREIQKFSGKGARKRALDYIIAKAEERGIFIGKTVSFHRIEVGDMRGLFISHDYCPFIVINRADSLSAQIFSLIHELAHLFRKSESISNSLEFRTNQRNQNPEETFCNQVAAELLLPASDFVNRFYDKRDIDTFSEHYKVSPLAIFYRLKEMGKIRIEQEEALERQIKRETSEAIRQLKEERSKNSGGDYNISMRDSNGKLFTRIVANRYLSNDLNYVEASSLLKFNVEKA